MKHRRTVPSPDTVTGVLLAGGQGSRMGGQDKGLLPLAGRPLAAHIVTRLRPHVSHLLINANRNTADYATLDAPVVADELMGYQGPLAGMLAAMQAATTDWIITVPCDSPLLAADYVMRMTEAADRSHAAIAVARSAGWLQPVFALIACDLAADLHSFLAGGDRKIDRWFERHEPVAVDFDDRPEMFENLNTPEELAAMDSRLRDEARPG